VFGSPREKMKIYKDFISGDEVLSDSFPISVVDDIVYEVKTKLARLCWAIWIIVVRVKPQSANG